MQAILTSNLNLPPKSLKRINACRLFLQVLTLTDICHGSGNTISVNILRGTRHEDRRSRYTWPNQSRPSEKSVENLESHSSESILLKSTWKSFSFSTARKLVGATPSPPNMEQCGGSLKSYVNPKGYNKCYLAHSSKSIFFLCVPS